MFYLYFQAIISCPPWFSQMILERALLQQIEAKAHSLYSGGRMSIDRPPTVAVLPASLSPYSSSNVGVGVGVEVSVGVSVRVAVGVSLGFSVAPSDPLPPPPKPPPPWVLVGMVSVDSGVVDVDV